MDTPTTELGQLATADVPVAKLVAIVAALGTVLAARLLFLTDNASKYPLWGQEFGNASKRKQHYLQNPFKAYQDGYKKFKDTAWRIEGNDGEEIVLPIKYADELRKIPDDIVNNVVSLEDLVETKHTDLSPDNPLMIHVIKADLTHNLPRLNLILSDEVTKAVADVIGPCENPTEVPIFKQLLQIVAIVSTTVFVGPELSRDQAWLNSAINYTIDVFEAAAHLKQWPRFMRPIAAKLWVPKVQSLQKHKTQARKLLAPLIRQRQALREAEADEKPNDMLQWLVDKAPKFDQDTEQQLALVQLTLSLAAIHTTTMAATHTMYDIVGHCPEIIPELRAEIAEAVARHDGILSTKALFDMKLLDSVMRESQRLNPTGVQRMVRRVLKPFEFSDGTKIPAGATVTIPLQAVLADETHYTDPDVFNPHRFLKLRQGEAKDPMQYPNKEQYQFVSVTRENMGFGYGRHACPGRFFASNEIKLIIADILLHYDIALPKGVSGRFPNLLRGSSMLPDPTKMIIIQRAAAM